MDMLIDATLDLDKLVRDSVHGVVGMQQLADVARLTHLALAAHSRQLAQASWAQKALLKENAILAKALMDGPGCGNSWAEDAAEPQIVAMGHLMDALKPSTTVMP